MATKTKKTSKKTAGRKPAAKAPAKKGAASKTARAGKKAAPAKKQKRPVALFTQDELDAVDAALRPSLGDAFTDKVIAALEDAVGTPPQL